MIELLAFAAVIVFLGLGLPWLFADVRRSRVSCRCGASKTDDAVIFEPSDVERIRDILTENCPICRTRRSGPQTRPEGTKDQSRPDVRRDEGAVTPPTEEVTA